MCMLGQWVWDRGCPTCSSYGGLGGPPLLDYDNSSSRFVGLEEKRAKTSTFYRLFYPNAEPSI